MNLKELAKRKGIHVRLRPIPTRIDASGSELPPADDEWVVEDILSKPNRVHLTNPITGHFVEIHSDNIREYRSPGFLVLRCSLIISPAGISIEPILRPHGPIPIARYQLAKTYKTQQWLTVDAVTCDGCTAAVQFRPLITIGLGADSEWSPTTERFCPRCSEARGVPFMLPEGMTREQALGPKNPTFMLHIDRMLRTTLLRALSADEDIASAGVLNVGGTISRSHVTFMPEHPRHPRLEVPILLAELAHAGAKQELDVFAYGKKAILAAVSYRHGSDSGSSDV